MAVGDSVTATCGDIGCWIAYSLGLVDPVAWPRVYAPSFGEVLSPVVHIG